VTKYRLVTRSDFDGLVCGVLLKELGLIDEITFVHPKDMQDGKIAVSSRDITTNLPYVPGCHLAFDHHSSEMERIGRTKPANHIIDEKAPSAARVVYQYFGGRSRFSGIGDDLMDAVDKADAAQFSHDEILNAEGWVLLSFLMDARTGLGRFRQFRISNYDLMMQLIERCRTQTVEQILASPDVKERVDLYKQHEPRFRDQLSRCSQKYGEVVVLDLRDEETIFAGNRFMIYAMFPAAKVSIHVLWGLKNQNTVFAVGKSIIDRRSSVDIGALCLSYGGGGHSAAGTCQVANDQADKVKAELINKLRGVDGPKGLAA
jgi:nanoRNase/pAp phosphatase (c-di-AMP/oligoRNAs hydrolase)